jgi:hypothetical protein
MSQLSFVKSLLTFVIMTLGSAVAGQNAFLFEVRVIGIIVVSF